MLEIASPGAGSMCHPSASSRIARGLASFRYQNPQIFNKSFGFKVEEIFRGLVTAFPLSARWWGWLDFRCPPVAFVRLGGLSERPKAVGNSPERKDETVVVDAPVDVALFGFLDGALAAKWATSNAMSGQSATPPAERSQNQQVPALAVAQ